MKLFLIRHAESEHNVQGILAGITDSKLTNHGILQIQRLANYLASNGVRFTQIFTSDLQRASMTADGIRNAQVLVSSENQPIPEVVQLPVLREQDFGSNEGKPWTTKAKENDTSSNVVQQQNLRPKESKEALHARAEQFLDDCLTPLLWLDGNLAESVAVVSHGIFLASLWRALLARFPPNSVTLAPENHNNSQLLEYLPAWSNTGYLELNITPQEGEGQVEARAAALEPSSGAAKLNGWRMTIATINSKEHLTDLKRTRGGLGNVTYDARQQTMDNFFRKPKVTAPAGS